MVHRLERTARLSTLEARRLRRRAVISLATLVAMVPCEFAMGNPSDASYRLVFADEFNGTALDTTKWSAASPGWTMPNSDSTATASQVSVGNGELTLNATRNATAFTSGSISSYQKYNFAGGYAEARIELPTTPGSWPAFWGLYTGWPPEIDIMEYPLTTNGGTNGYNNNSYHTAYHYTNTSGAAAAGAGQVTTGQNLGTTGYHIFAMDWVAGTSVKFYLDGAQVSSYTGSSVAQMVNMYMIMDYAVGGWPGTPTTAQWNVGQSDQTKVDWIHVWQKNAGADAPSSWNLNGGGAFGTGGNWTAGTPMYGNQTAIFGRVGAASAATITMGSWHVMGGITFDGMTTGALAGTTAYTLGTNATQIQLASTTGTATVQATAASTANQIIGADVELWSNTTVRNDMAGGQTLSFTGELSGSGALSAVGVGTTVLNASSTYTGGTNIGINQETAVLQVNADGALGTGGVVIGAAGNTTTARMEVAGSHVLSNNIDFRGRTTSTVGIRNVSGSNILDGTITATAGGNIYQIASDAGTLTLRGASGTATAAGVSLQSGSGARTFTLQGAGSGIVKGKIQNGGGTVSIIKDGTGMWTLAGSNSYTGLTSVAAGTLAFAGSPSSVAGITVANGANLRVQSAGVNTTTLTSTSLALGTGGTSALTFDFNSTDTVAPLANVGAMTVSGPVTVGLQNAGVLLSGTHALMGYTSSSGTGTFSGSPFTLGPRSTGTLVSSATAMSLVVAGDRPIWTGLDGSNWQVGATGASKNWKLQSATTSTDYLSGDNVLFDDSASGSSTISISGANVSPAATTFNNTTKSYTVASSGGFGITGSGPVNKSGAGTVTFASSNSYTGLTTITGGAISISTNSNIGDASAPVLLNGGALRTTAGITNTHPVTFGVSGGTLNVTSAGQLYFHTPNTLLGSGAMTLTGNGTLTVNVGNLRIDQTNSYSGAVTVTSGGIFEYGTAGAVSAGATFNIGNQGEVAVQGYASTEFPNTITVSGGTNSVLSFENSTTGEVTGPVILNANVIVGLRDWYNYASVRSGTISGVISGAGGLTVNSGSGTGGVLTLNANNTFTGNIVVNGSTIIAENGSNTGSPRTSGPLGNTTTAGKTVTINSGGVVSFTKGNTLGGGGSATAPALTFIVNTGGTLKTATTDIGGAGAGDANIFGNINLAGGTFTTGNGYSEDWQAAILLGSVTVSGTSASTINTNASNTAANGVMLGAANAGTHAVVFNVADVTGTTGTDLTVSARLTDSASSATNATYIGAMTKAGAGTMNLTAINTYTGGTTVSGGTMLLGAGGSAGTIRGALTIAAGATVKLNIADALGYSAGTSVTQININSGTLDNAVAGNNSYAASWNLAGGAMTASLNGTWHINAGGGCAINSLANGATSSIAGAVQIRGANSVLPITVADGGANVDLIMSGAIANSATEAGANGLQKLGPGTLALSAANTLTGPVTISAGTLQLGNLTSTGSLSPLSSIIDNGTLAINRTTTTTQGTDFASNIIGTGSFSQIGSGTTVLNSSNNYAGGTLLSAGTLAINNASAIGTGTVTINGGTLNNTSGTSIALTSNNAQAWNGNFVFSASLPLNMGTGNVTIGGTGDRVVTTSSSSLTVGELRSASQNFTKAGVGTLVLGSTGAGTNGSVVGGVLTVSAGALQFNRSTSTAADSGDLTVKGLGGTGTLSNGSTVARTLYVNSTTDTTFPGKLINGTGGGPLGLTKSGAGALTLTGLNKTASYTGGTTVTDGLLEMNIIPSASSVTITGGTLRVTATDADGAGPGTQGSAAGVSRLTSLSIDAAGRMDLRNNGLIIPSTGQINGSAISVDNLRSLIVAGRGGTGTGAATWSSAGGIGTSLFAFDETYDSIGYVWSGDPNLLVPPISVNGESFATGDYLVKYCAGADADLNGAVDDTDVAVIGLTYDNGATTGHHWYEGDFNYDGMVDDSDVAILGLGYNPGATPLSPAFYAALSAEYGSSFASAFAAGASGTVVPEPTIIGFLALGALGLRRRRR